MTIVAREHYLSKIDGITFGEDPRNGFVREGRFYHPNLAFEFPVPPGYSVINQAQQVVLVAGDEQAVIQMTIDSEHQTAAAASDAFAAQEGLQLVERGMGSANGLPARYVVVDAQTETGGVIRVRAHFIDYGGRVYVFLGMSNRDAFANYDPQFQLVMRGFTRVTSESVLAVQPNRLDLSRTNSNAPFQALLPGSLPQSLTPTAMAILNQVQLDTVLPGGTLYKLVR
jgi:predicted Zn-dependent protease